jgi:hypothetical protein
VNSLLRSTSLISIRKTNVDKQHYSYKYFRNLFVFYYFVSPLNDVILCALSTVLFSIFHDLTVVKISNDSQMVVKSIQCTSATADVKGNRSSNWFMCY